MSEIAGDTQPTPVTAIEFFTRPGCGFSARLERALRGAAIPIEIRDIWQDPEAAAAVRSITGGSETVPTLRIGSVGLINPSPHEVLDAMLAVTPDLVPEHLRD